MLVRLVKRSIKYEINEAIKDFTRAVEVNANYASAYYNRRIAHTKQGEIEETIEQAIEKIILK